jgi:hypothetical protein
MLMTHIDWGSEEDPTSNSFLIIFGVGSFFISFFYDLAT